MVANIISQERLTKYMIAAGGDAEFSLKLYGWNIQISEAFFPVLSAAEVCLRNTVSARLIQVYGHRWWENTEFHSLSFSNRIKGQRNSTPHEKSIIEKRVCYVWGNDSRTKFRVLGADVATGECCNNMDTSSLGVP